MPTYPPLTPAMAAAGYETLKKIASDQGFGWEFGMVSERDVEVIMGQIYTAMIHAAPPANPIPVKG
jgi:hypothetical protein